ncbi:saccharopine dehydrogenase (NADP+, L-glutamate-forming), partial [Coemansia sp. RSA 2703]
MRPLDAAAYDAYDAYSPTFSSASASPSPGQAAAAQALFARARPASMCAEPLVRPASLCLDGATKPASFCSDRPADYASAIWHADVLRVPEPPAATTAVLLDPTNPYLGDFISRRGTRAARSSTASSALQTTLWRASSSTHSHVGPAEPPTLGHAQASLWRASSSTRSHVSVSAPLKTSPPPPQRLAVGPCRPSPPTSHEPIPEEPTVPKSSILLLGSGFVAEPCLEYLMRSGNNRVTIACRRLEKARELSDKYAAATGVSLDVEDDAALEAAVAAHDLTISLIPYTQHARVMKAAIKARKHVVTTSYISPAMEELDQAARDAGIICMNEIGLDPGIDHLYALKIINEVHAAGGRITSFESFCGGLPAPEDSNNPLGYKFSWSARGVLLALRNNARYWQDGNLVEIQGKDLMDSARPIYIYPAFATVGYGNRDSSHYRERYNIPHARTCVRGTMRYQGFPEFAKTLVNMGFLDDTPQPHLAAADSAAPLPWNTVTAQLLGSPSADPADLLAAIESKIDTQDPEARKRVLHGIKWLGITSPDVAAMRRGTYLDVLCARLEELM